MADFVAVIRRAVDGLANNTPEMRVKVYDKARSAVVRQLESMKPRPPETLFQRQLEKLEQAISEVEAEHAEALPAEEELSPAVIPVPEPVAPEPVAEVVPEEPPVEQQGQALDASPAEQQPETDAPSVPDQAPQPEEVHSTVVEPEPVGHSYQEPEPQNVYESEPQAPVYAEPEHAVYEEAAPEAPVEPEPVATPEPAYAHYEEPAVYEPAPETIAHVETGYADDQPEYAETEQAPEDYIEAGAVSEPVPEPYAPEVVAADEVPVKTVEPLEPIAESEPLTATAVKDEHYWPEDPLAPAVAEAKQEGSWDWPSHVELELPAAAPAVQDASRAADSIIDDFDAYLEGRSTSATEPKPVVETPQATQPSSQQQANDAWSDFEALIGYDAGKPGAAVAGAAAVATAGAAVASVAAEVQANGNAAAAEADERPVPETAYPYRAVPKPRPNIAKIGLAGLAVLLLAGGGYALWLNRDALTNLFNGPTTPSGTPVVATGNGSPTPNNGAAQPVDPAHKIDDGATATKFTQRLTSDGKEIDEGPATGTAGSPKDEGQSVAQQNVAPPPQTQAPASGQPPAGTATAPVATGEKMYLYEEMLGQTTPTAIEGGVVWEARDEKDETGAVQTVVQGTITVPGRNLTALVTFKRNTDPSLPASHLVEIVFSLPAGFEGGAIESVQRISMKRTEQDRGNALIAVPARITDDFHMIALNDFPDARATNLELLRSRDWIDIPVTYRNGRRALLTMEKGKTGMDAFNKAVAQWQQVEAAKP